VLDGVRTVDAASATAPPAPRALECVATLSAPHRSLVQRPNDTRVRGAGPARRAFLQLKACKAPHPLQPIVRPATAGARTEQRSAPQLGTTSYGTGAHCGAPRCGRRTPVPATGLCTPGPPDDRHRARQPIPRQVPPLLESGPATDSDIMQTGRWSHSCRRPNDAGSGVRGRRARLSFR
jgi:hypothetical protein